MFDVWKIKKYYQLKYYSFPLELKKFTVSMLAVESQYKNSLLLKAMIAMTISFSFTGLKKVALSLIL